MFNRKTCSGAMLVMSLLAFASGCSALMVAIGQPAPGAATPTASVLTDDQGRGSPATETLLTWEGRMTIGDNDRGMR